MHICWPKECDSIMINSSWTKKDGRCEYFNRVCYSICVGSIVFVLYHVGFRRQSKRVTSDPDPLQKNLGLVGRGFLSLLHMTPLFLLLMSNILIYWKCLLHLYLLKGLNYAQILIFNSTNINK